MEMPKVETVAGAYSSVTDYIMTVGPTSYETARGGSHVDKRIARVVVSDSNENVPVDRSILYDSGEIKTDLTDEELYFGIGIAKLLESHNVYRITVVDRKASKNRDRDLLLEPAKIRDLKMTVLTIAKL